MARAVFKYLLFNPGKQISTEKLTDTFYHDVDQAGAGKRLHQATSSLRTALEPGISPKRESSYLIHREGSYQLILPETSYVDAFEFESLCREASHAKKKGDLHHAISCYRTAIELYRGDLLEEDIYEEWTVLLRDRYAGLYVKALRELSLYYFDRFEYESCMETLHKLLEREELNEEAYLLLIKSYLAIGDRAKAIKTYKRCCKILKDELNIEPDRVLSELYMGMIGKNKR